MITSPVSFWSQQLILACQSANIKGAAVVLTVHCITTATTVKLKNAQLWLPFLYSRVNWNALWRICCLIQKYCSAVVFTGLYRAKKLTVREMRRITCKQTSPESRGRLQSAGMDLLVHSIKKTKRLNQDRLASVQQLLHWVSSIQFLQTTLHKPNKSKDLKDFSVDF